MEFPSPGEFFRRVFTDNSLEKRNWKKTRKELLDSGAFTLSMRLVNELRESDSTAELWETDFKSSPNQYSLIIIFDTKQRDAYDLGMDGDGEYEASKGVRITVDRTVETTRYVELSRKDRWQKVPDELLDLSPVEKLNRQITIARLASDPMIGLRALVSGGGSRKLHPVV